MVDHFIGGVLEVIGLITSKSFGAAYRALDSYDGRRVRWVTTAAAAVGSALYVPMVVGAFFGLRAVWHAMSSGFAWFIGFLFLFPALLVVAMALSAVAMGIAVGGWLLIDRPGARWYAGVLAGGGLISAIFVLSMQTWVTRVIGWSTLGLSAALLVLVLLPRTELSVAPPEPVPSPSLTQPVTRRRRFVL